MKKCQKLDANPPSRNPSVSCNWHSTARTLWCAWAQGSKGQRAPSTLQHSILFVHYMPMYMYCIYTYELMHIHICHSMLMMFMISELWYRAWIHFWESPMRPCSPTPVLKHQKGYAGHFSPAVWLNASVSSNAVSGSAENLWKVSIRLAWPRVAVNSDADRSFPSTADAIWQNYSQI